MKTGYRKMQERLQLQESIAVNSLSNVYKKTFKIFLNLPIICLVLQACATVPTAQQAASLNTQIASSDFAGVAKSAVAVGKLDGKGGGDILWQMEAGAASLHAGNMGPASQYLEFVDNTINKDDLKSIKVDFDYHPRVFDKMMVNTYKALAFLGNNQKNEARIEFWRIVEREQKAREFYDAEAAAIQSDTTKKVSEGNFDITGALGELKKSKEYSETMVDLQKYNSYAAFVNPLPVYLRAVFLMTNTTGSSDNEYAVQDFKKVASYLPPKNGVLADVSLAEAQARGKAAPPMVWVVLENGQSPALQPYNVTFPVPVLAQKGVTAGLVTVALPKFAPNVIAYDGFDVQASTNRSASFMLSDFDAVMGAEFNKRYPDIVTMAVAEVALKMVLQSAANKSNNALLSFAAKAVSQVSTVDTRSWTLLPKKFEVARVPTPKDGTIVIQPHGGNAISVTVPAGKSSIVMLKSMRPGSPLAVTQYLL